MRMLRDEQFFSFSIDISTIHWVFVISFHASQQFHSVLYLILTRKETNKKYIHAFFICSHHVRRSHSISILKLMFVCVCVSFLFFLVIVSAYMQVNLGY